VDFFSEDGTWFDSRDIARPDPSDWPTSFSVWSADLARPKRVMLRLRVYPAGRTRGYTGERFIDQGVPPPDGPGPDDQNPRLMRDGQDITPATEPLPGASVDRLVLLHLTPGVRGRIRVTLGGECAGTMAMLSQTAPYQAPVFGEAQTCVDTAGSRVGLE